jgi:hypothetical protein
MPNCSPLMSMTQDFGLSWRSDHNRLLLAQSCSGSPLLVLPHVSVEWTFVSWLPIIAEGKHSYDLEYQLPTEAP